MLDSDKRPWGLWEEYLNEDTYRVKRIIVEPGKRISLQKHAKRAEHWVIVAGKGTFTLNDTEQDVSAGESVFIKKADVHRVECISKEALIIIETQIGICDEDDIVRLEDDWKRN